MNGKLLRSGRVQAMWLACGLVVAVTAHAAPKRLPPFQMAVPSIPMPEFEYLERAWSQVQGTSFAYHEPVANAEAGQVTIKADTLDGSLDTPPVARLPLVAFVPYPTQLQNAHVSGTVRARLSIDETGQVAKVEILKSTLPEFGERVQTRLGRYVFTPATQNGAPTACSGVFTIGFDVAGH